MVQPTTSSDTQPSHSALLVPFSKDSKSDTADPEAYLKEALNDGVTALSRKLGNFSATPSATLMEADELVSRLSKGYAGLEEWHASHISDWAKQRAVTRAEEIRIPFEPSYSSFDRTLEEATIPYAGVGDFRAAVGQILPQELADHGEDIVPALTTLGRSFIPFVRSHVTSELVKVAKSIEEAWDHIEEGNPVTQTNMRSQILDQMETAHRLSKRLARPNFEFREPTNEEFEVKMKEDLDYGAQNTDIAIRDFLATSKALTSKGVSFAQGQNLAKTSATALWDMRRHFKALDDFVTHELGSRASDSLGKVTRHFAYMLRKGYEDCTEEEDSRLIDYTGKAVTDILDLVNQRRVLDSPPTWSSVRFKSANTGAQNSGFPPKYNYFDALTKRLRAYPRDPEERIKEVIANTEYLGRTLGCAIEAHSDFEAFTKSRWQDQNSRQSGNTTSSAGGSGQADSSAAAGETNTESRRGRGRGRGRGGRGERGGNRRGGRASFKNLTDRTRGSSSGPTEN